MKNGVRALNKVVDGDFAARMVRNIQQGLDSEDYGAGLARIDEQLVSLQKELMAIARMNVREAFMVVSILRSIESCRKNLRF